jgi:hypothetical protein
VPCAMAMPQFAVRSLAHSPSSTSRPGRPAAAPGTTAALQCRNMLPNFLVVVLATAVGAVSSGDRCDATDFGGHHCSAGLTNLTSAAITTGPQVWLAPLLYARARRTAC